MLCGMWDLPGPGLEPMSPALAGGFLTAALPGESLKLTSNCVQGPGLLIVFLLATPLFVPFLYLFPLAQTESPSSVRGGWSGVGLCWLRSVGNSRRSNSETLASPRSMLAEPCLSFCVLGDEHCFLLHPEDNTHKPGHPRVQK